MGLFQKNRKSSAFGKDLPWLMAVNRIMRVTEFDKLNTKIKGGLPVQRNPFKPYGYLIVDSHGLGEEVRLPIIHRDDFGLAASVFDVPSLEEYVSENELLVVYAPQDLLPDGRSGSPQHVLHYALAPRGTLDAYYTMNSGIHESDPNLEIIFGDLIYSGEIAVRPISRDITGDGVK